MLTQIRTITVKKGFADEAVVRFAKPGILETKKGLIDRSVHINRKTKDKETEEVVLIIRWESKEDWKNWEKSPEHIAGHRAKKDTDKPEYILDMNIQMLELVAEHKGTYQE